MTGTHIEQLNRRVRQYGRLAVWALITAGLGAIVTYDFWTGFAPASNTAFKEMNLPFPTLAYWQANVSNPDATLGAGVIRPLINIALIIGGIMLVVIRRPKWLLLLVVVSVLWCETEDAHYRRSGYYTRLPEQIMAAQIEHLQPTTAAQPQSGPPKVPQSEVEYVIAQYFYLQGDTVATRIHLEAIRADEATWSNTDTWRIAVMEEWLAAKGKPVKAGTFAPRLGIGFLTLGEHRILGGIGLLISGLGLAAAVLLAILLLVMGARVRRLANLAAQVTAPLSARRGLGASQAQAH